MAKTATPKIGLLRATAGHRTLQFGLVRVGISMGPALDESTRVKGSYICADHSCKVSQKYECPGGHTIDGRPTRAFPYGDQFVILDDGEVPQAASDDVIELIANVGVEEIPSEWIAKTFMAWPTDTTHDEAYMLVAACLRDEGRALIGTTVDHGTTKAFVIRWSDLYGCLIAQVLSYHANVRWANVELVKAGVSAISEPTPEALGLAKQLLGAVPNDFAWDEVEDDYGIALEQAVREKATTGGVTALPTTEDVKVENDLLAALRASVAA